MSPKFIFIPSGFLLDLYPGAAAAYSLRQLKTGITNVVRVRRSSDDAEQDFTVSEITGGTLLAFTGAGDGFIVTWYDQSGNIKDLEQSAAASQPKIVSSGALILDVNNNPLIEFDGIDDYLNTSSQIIAFNESYISAFSVNSKFSSWLHSNPTGSSSDWIWRIVNNFADTNAIHDIVDSDLSNFGVTLPASGRNLLSGVYKKTEATIDLSINGAAATQNTTSGLDFRNRPNNRLIIGAAADIVTKLPSQANEFILYLSDQTANRTGIDTDINDHYNIYP